ncbi:MAG: HlyC/CorC family transporter [Blastochloris sp.]|nr:HlyC/CorC family transporter [Blastochloris sp.]
MFTIFILLLTFTLLNGIFAMAEIALVSSRKGKLKQMAQEGNAGAEIALGFIEAPSRFLSTVQVVITLAGVVGGAFGGAQLAPLWSPLFAELPVVGIYANEIAFSLAIILVTFLQLVLGELVPKRLAMNYPETISAFMAKPMNLLSVCTSPIVSLLSNSTDFVLSALGIKPTAAAAITDDEVRLLIDQGLSAGVFKKSEKDLVDGVLSFDELKVEDLMTPAAKIVWMDLELPDEENWRRVVASAHSHFPVCEGDKNKALGMISVKALWANQSLAGVAKIRDVLTDAVYVPMVMPAPRLLETFKTNGKHVALVTDEFGSIEGLVTLIDVMEAIVGAIPSKDQAHRLEARKRADGSWIFEALISTDDFKERLGILNLPNEDTGEYSTLSGFILSYLGHIPRDGEKFIWNKFQFEIMDMDEHRIDKVLVIPPK